MKNIAKKEWGIVGTSIGSLLIIVALLTMVGIGSNGTYAATTCTCPSGYTQNGKNCTRVVYKDQKTTCCLGGNCSGSGYSTCTSGVQCGSTKTESGATLCQNPKVPNTETVAATCTTTVKCSEGEYHVGQGHCRECPAGYWCPGGTFNYGDQNVGMNKCPDGTISSAGKSSKSDCVSTSQTTCPAGQYYLDSSKKCTSCEAGYYCPGVTADMSKLEDQGLYSCPENATCTSSSFTCNSGYHKNSSGTGCEKDTTGGNSGGNTGGNTGGNASTPSGGNSGLGGNGDNGNTNQNPNTATKTPLVIAIIGTMSMALGTFAYFKGKKEINTEI